MTIHFSNLTQCPSARRATRCFFVSLLLVVGGMSGVNAQDEPTTFKINGGAPIELKAPPPVPSSACQAVIALSFHQRNTLARVEGSIENTMCAASSGDYELTVTYKGLDGEQKMLEFTETWQRSDGETVMFVSDYEIGENVDLMRVRARRAHCVCAEAGAQQP
jgi:hypothetical protein